MSPDLQLVERSGYTIFDLLADVGGISGLLFSVASYLLSIFNSNFFDNYLASKLFTLGSRDSDGKTSHHPIQTSTWCGIGEYCASLCARCCGRNLSRKDRAMRAAREELAHETDIITLIRSQRLLKMVISQI